MKADGTLFRDAVRAMVDEGLGSWNFERLSARLAEEPTKEETRCTPVVEIAEGGAKVLPLFNEVDVEAAGCNIAAALARFVVRCTKTPPAVTDRARDAAVEEDNREFADERGRLLEPELATLGSAAKEPERVALGAADESEGSRVPCNLADWADARERKDTLVAGRLV